MKRARYTLIVALAAILLLGACSSKDDSTDDAAGATTTVATGTYADNGVTFEYPGEWTEFTQNSEVEAGNKLWATSYGPDVPSNEQTTNFVAVQSYQLNQQVTEDNIADLKSSVEAFVQQLVEQGGGQIDSGPTETSMGDIPGYEFDISGIAVNDVTTASKLLLVFQGDIEYFVNCQYAAEAETDILAGCDLVVDSFAIDA
jgi:hypothetical protein